MRPKIYVGCGLTNAPEVFRNQVDKLKDTLATDLGVSVLNFVGLGASSDGDVYRHDISCVDECDGMVAICDYPSTGLGMEIGRAINTGKPVLGLAQINTHVTRMATGMAEVEPSTQFARYESIDKPQNIVSIIGRLLLPQLQK